MVTSKYSIIRKNTHSCIYWRKHTCALDMVMSKTGCNCDETSCSRYGDIDPVCEYFTKYVCPTCSKCNVCWVVRADTEPKRLYCINLCKKAPDPRRMDHS
jgi:hypothetical protein